MFASVLLSCVAVQAQATPQADAYDWQAAVEALAPSYVRWDGGSPDTDVIPELLQALLAEQAAPRESAADERVFQRAIARIGPNLTESDCDLLLLGLIENRWADAETAHELLMAAPVSESRGILLRGVLDKRLSIAVRADAVERYLAADGREALDAIRGLLKPETEAILLRRIYRSWRGMLQAEDLPLLEQLVEEGPGICRELALQTWASAETTPEKRVRILRLSESSGREYRNVVFRELAAHGGDEAVNEYMRTLFQAPSQEDRRLARQYASMFLGPEAVFEQWQQSAESGLSDDQQGQWMLDLARLPLAEARQTAAEWFLSGGAVESRYAFGLGRLLSQTDALDDSLARLLRNEELKPTMRVQIASQRSPHNEEARRWLREQLPEAEGMLAVQLVRGLGSGQSTRDASLLVEIAADATRRGVVRVEAIRGLLKLPNGDEAMVSLLDRFTENRESDFETLEILVELGARSEHAATRSRALAIASEGLGLSEASERAALQRAAWRGQGFSPRADEAQALRVQAESVLLNTTVEDPLQAWGDPREMRGHGVDLAVVVVALAASSSAEAEAPPIQLEGGGPTSWRARYLWAEAAMRAAPRASVRIASQLASDPRLLRSNRLRALGLCARAAGLAGEFEAELNALGRIANLLREDDIDQDLYDLALGLGLSSPRAWIVPEDEIGQRMLLAEARSIPVGRGNVLEGLLSGGSQVSVLLEAAEILGDGDSWSASLRFSERASDLEPANVYARWLQGRAWQELALYEYAELAFLAAVRLGGTNAALAADAEQRLRAIAESDR